MLSGMNRFLAGLMITAMIAASLLGCSALNRQVVMPGDQADVHFTCRLKNGEVAASSYQAVGKDPSLPKASFFLPRDQNAPVTVKARNRSEDRGTREPQNFEGEILHRLSYVLAGQEVEKKYSVEIRAEEMPAGRPGEHITKIARIRHREKELRLLPDEYKRKTGKAPEVGQDFIYYDPAMPGKVEKVSETEVYIRFPAPPGKGIKTPFGRGIVQDAADRWEIVIDAHPGSLVRSGGFVGRIVNVNNRFITIDYGQPFGGEPLFCDVTIEAVKPSQPEKK